MGPDEDEKDDVEETDVEEDDQVEGDETELVPFGQEPDEDGLYLSDDK